MKEFNERVSCREMEKERRKKKKKNRRELRGNVRHLILLIVKKVKLSDGQVYDEKKEREKIN